MDPRFSNSAGKLNQGLFERSYTFIKDVQNDRFKELKHELKEADRIGDHDAAMRIRQLLGNERDFVHKQKAVGEE